MAVGLKADTSPLYPVAGIRLGAVSAGIKKDGREDLVLIEIAPGGHAAAVFTRNAFCAAPVTVARRHLCKTPPRFLLINSGNANAGTGAPGIQAALSCCTFLAEQQGCRPEEVLPFSTGVIGEPLNISAFRRGIPRLCGSLNEAGWLQAAQGIMTTDTVSKAFSERLEIAGRTVTLTGICKGAGMIQPDMATMLAFIATDVALAPDTLQDCLQRAVAQSFHCISVDGDTSTNDACVLLATGRSSLPLIEDADSQPGAQFMGALVRLCRRLAQVIVRDGEGATKFMTIEVSQGSTEAECRHVAFIVANSPLVKTAFFASDPNWGRILAAVGRSGLEHFAIESVNIFLNELCIVRQGERAADYQEEAGSEVMQLPEIVVRIELGRGSAAAQVWSCDLSYEYVRINAEYRT